MIPAWIVIQWLIMIFTPSFDFVWTSKIVPFAALIKADDASFQNCFIFWFCCNSFLRIKDQDIATNILNRENFAFNGCERRFRQPVSEDNWQQAVSEERAIRLLQNRLIQCKITKSETFIAEKPAVANDIVKALGG